MTSVPELAFSHLGIYVTDPARMEDFYTRVLGFAVTDRGMLGAVSLVFLSRDAREHHQIVLASGRPPAGFNTVNQISFRMGDFAGFREMHRRLEKQGVAELAPVTHGNALSMYFKDPEGNRIELFVDTPWYVEQPVRVPLNMKLSDAELWAWAERDARARPGFRPVEEWRAELRRRLAQSR